VAHCRSHLDCLFRRVRHRQWIVEENHHAITGETFQSPFVLKNQFTHFSVILV